MMFKPVATEKAVKLIDLDNTLVFEVPLTASKPYIKKEIEFVFSVKVKKMRISIRNNKKFVYVRLAAENPAIDVATKLGII